MKKCVKRWGRKDGRDVWDNIQLFHVCVIGVSKEEENRTEETFEDVMYENFSILIHLVKDYSQIQET